MDVLGGRYRLVELIGSGGMAVVWRAHDDVLGRPVAVKILSPTLAKDASFRQRIQREARAAARLAHPHVSVVHDFGVWTDSEGALRPYVVMELIDGPSLGEALSAGQVPWFRAAAICAQVAEGLAAAHARGLVHHDVKPANIVLSTTGPKIVDFGISSIVGEEDEEGAVLGTPGFVAPERIQGNPIEPASDVYALGLTLYRCIAGKAPWDADTAESLLFAHVHTAPRPLPRHDAAGSEAPVPDELIEICERCLAKEPDQRPTAGELAEVLAGLPVPENARRRRPPARPAPVDGGSALNVTAFLPPADNEATAVIGGARQPRPRRGRQAALAGVAATLVVAAIGVAVWAGTDKDAHEANAAPTTSGPPPLACTATYWVRTDNGSRFTGELMLANSGQTAINGEWSLTFAFAGGQRVERLGGQRAPKTMAATATATATPRPASWTQDGATVTVRPWLADPKAVNLDPQHQVSLPFEGSYKGSNSMPGGFSVNGTACQAVLLGPVDAPPPSRPAGGDGGPVVTSAVPTATAQVTTSDAPHTERPTATGGPGGGETTAAPPPTTSGPDPATEGPVAQ